MRKLITIVSSAALLFSLAGTAIAAPGSRGGAEAKAKPPTDNLSSPLGTKQAKAKAKALEAVVSGKAKAKGKNKVVKVGKGQYVELAFQGEDPILTVLTEFGDQIHPVTGGTAGPVHNQIPAPDRNVDNTTIWTDDFSRDYYHDLLYSKTTFPSMANFYLEQSSGQYSVTGEVTDWVQVPFNEARYGTNLCGSIVCSTVWDLIDASADLMWNDLVAEKGSVAAANAFLASFDVWDRYDYDGDGNFNEPDGYIDHFQSVHAGDGEETGGGAQGDDAIWSHRWYAFFGANGPDGEGPHAFGGIQIGDSDFWIGDYTIEPENGGVGVFAHEFAHDLGLPDEYETSGNTGGAENSTAWWTLMSQGSYGTQTNDLGSAPVHMNAWDKIQLGFIPINLLAIASSEDSGRVKLGPAEYNTNNPQAFVVVLPDKQVTFDVGEPFEGDWMYFSGSGNAFTHTMSRSFTLPAGSPMLTAKVKYDAEEEYDFGFVTVNGEPVETNLSTTANQSGSNTSGFGITGSSGGNWVDLTADLTAFAGQTVDIGFSYVTDPAVAGDGFFYDNIEVTGSPVDGAETDTGWDFDGFGRTQSTIERSFFNAYVAEFRQYRLYDKALQTGPYNFGFLNDPDLQNYVEHFPYQEGLLIWYWNDQYAAGEDNNVADHPGEGWILPVDAHPQPLHWSDGTLMRPRIQSFDSTFSVNPTKKITLHKNGVATTIPSRPGVAVFDDTQDWWFDSDGHDHSGETYQQGWIGVNVPKTGTTIRAGSASGSFMWVYLNQ